MSKKTNHKRLNDETVRKLTAPELRSHITWDTTVPGFGARITANGVVAFILNYRARSSGRQKQFKIGRYPDLTTTAARDMATKLRGRIAEGEDPLGDLEEERRSATVNALADDYLARHARPHKRLKSVQNDLSMLIPIRNRFGTRKVSDITRRDIDSFHQSLKDTPYQANRTLALLSKMFSLAVIWDWRTDNPCKGVQRFPEDKRTDWLSVEQLQRLGAILDSYKDRRIANALWLLILTGSRKSEALTARWSDFDLDRAEWTKSSHLTKQKKTETIPLNPTALSLLTEMKAQSNGSEFLFPGDVDGQPLVEIKKAWAAIRKAAGIEGTRIHDLRHTYASHLVSAGYSLPIVGKLLGHTNPKTTARYAHIANEAQREATDHMGSIVGPMLPTTKPDVDVTPPNNV